MFNSNWKLALALFSVLIGWSTVGAQETARQETTTGNSITGRVVSDSGQPLSNAIVFFRAANNLGLGRSTTSDGDGNFHLTGLDSGLYSFSASLATYVTPPRDPDAPPTYYRAGDTVRLELVKGGVVTGTVVNAAGEPVIELPVRAVLVRDSNGRLTKGAVVALGERSTDDRGIYRIYGLTPGGYIIQAGVGKNQYSTTPYDFDAPTFSLSSNRDTAAEITVRGGEEATADVRYRGEPGHVVSGTVKVRGTTGASVTLTTVGDGALPTATSFQAQGTYAFAFYGVGDGDYDIVAQEVLSQTPMNPDLAFSNMKRISVKGGDVTGLELITNQLATINGKFVLEASKLPECQKKRRPLFHETVVGLTRNQRDDQQVTQPLYLRLFASNAFPDKDGAFTFRNLRTGQYAFVPRFFARYWYVQSIAMAAAPGSKPSAPRPDVTRNWTIIKGSENISGLIITLAEGAASVRGQLSMPHDAPVPAKLKIYAVPAEREKSDDALRFFMAEPAADGVFSITNMLPGQYFLIAQTPDDKDPQTIDKLRLPDAAEARLKLRRAAEANKVTVELKPCQNLTDYKLPFSTAPRPN